MNVTLWPIEKIRTVCAPMPAGSPAGRRQSCGQSIQECWVAAAHCGGLEGVIGCGHTRSCSPHRSLGTRSSTRSTWDPEPDSGSGARLPPAR